jgi:hypothetical protein
MGFQQTAAMMISRLTLFGLLASSALGLGACSNTASEMLTTGSLFGAQPQAAAAAPEVVKPEDRAIHVAAVSARATKCGYYFDPMRLRTTYLENEAQRGIAPDELEKITKIYDFTNGKVTTTIASREGYCTDELVQEIKSNLTRHLAGDFEPPKKKKPVEVGLFDMFGETDNAQTTANPGHVHDPILNPERTPTEPQ